MQKAWKWIVIGCISLGMAVATLPVYAQAESYQLVAHRDFGYGSGINVRGDMSLDIAGNLDTIQSVTYQIDGKTLGIVTSAPFKLRYKTSAYPDGMHTLSAIVTTTDGRKITMPGITRNFLSAQQETQGIQTIIIPLAIILALVIVMVAGIQFLAMRSSGKSSIQGMRSLVGMKGGTICPNCGHAVPIHFWSLNLLNRYFNRCEVCGKWSLVSRRSLAELTAAEQALAPQAGEGTLPGAKEDTPEERQKKMIDDSRYTSE